MRFIKRVYVAGVGYTCYLTKAPVKTANPQGGEDSANTVKLNPGNAKNPIPASSKSVVTKPTGNQSPTKIQNAEVYLDHLKGSKNATPDKDYVYTLNLKIGFSDLKLIDLTPYLTEEIEILVVGKEIITTPGYQELAAEIESLITASEIKSIIIIRGENKVMVNSLAALIRNLRPYSVYKGIGLRLEGDPLILKTFVKNKHK